LSWQPVFASASAAGDIGYTYGSYADAGDDKPVRGYYLHVWKRLPAGWRLAAEIANVDAQARR